jgi:leucyl-tRNA synthetase
MDKYNPQKIEAKWQKQWAKDRLYETTENPGKKKFYALDMFPYPSGVGLHVGHPKGYIATDVFSRYKMLQGYSVLHPMGWDAFGLPAENYAIQTGTQPRLAVEKNIAVFKKQLEMFGFTYDWNREINTTDPKYYKWTQWIFLKLFEKGLAYESDEPVNWCPSCKTVLANEDLEDGKCERCGTLVVQRKLRQWVLKMTDYADRLLYDLDTEKLDWEEFIIEQQRNWIGRSEGATIKFEIKILNLMENPKSQIPNPKQIQNSNYQNPKQFLEVFTTRVDTIFGCTYCVVAPENKIILELKSKITNYSEVEKYIEKASNKTELERMEMKEKSGVEIKGIKVINPFNNEELPLFVADYVLAQYGTGAVMAVPAHDERDWEFAQKYKLPIKNVVEPKFVAGPDSESEVKKNEEFVKRNAVVVVVRNPKNDTYLCISWKTVHMNGFVTGGIEDGEDLVEAAKREVLEETGYKNLKLVRVPEIAIHSLFYHRIKKQNRWARFQYVFFDLENEEQKTVSEKEASLHEVVWKRKEEMKDFFSVIEGKFIVELMGGQTKAYTDDGVLYNSGEFGWMDSDQAREEMTNWLEKNNLGSKKVNYKMRDWVFSRQRYWGEPIPIIHCEKCGTNGVPEKDLPVELPPVENYTPTGTGESPLANVKEWVNVKCPKCGGKGKRETNTMPQWAGSSWYYLAYIMRGISNFQFPISKYKEEFKKWMPVDLYVGGAEHAARHLLYARFWHKFLFDIGVVSTKEPFTRFIHVGLINGEDGRKMSKRWGNVINPDDVIGEFGADSMRVYEMFMGPFSQSIAWSTKGVVGSRRFLEKVYKNANKRQISGEYVANKKLESLVHKTIKKVTEDIENFRFNTAISQMMILVNAFEKEEKISLIHYSQFLILLSPFAPHLAEEIWSSFAKASADKQEYKKSIFLESWPKYDEKLIQDEEIELIIQINGKVRDKIKVSADISEEEAKKLALESEKIKTQIAGKEIKKVIYVKGKLISIVI